MTKITFKKASHLVEGSKVQDYDHYVREAWVSTNAEKEVIIILTSSGKYEYFPPKTFPLGLPMTFDTFKAAVKVAERNV